MVNIARVRFLCMEVEVLSTCVTEKNSAYQFNNLLSVAKYISIFSIITDVISSRTVPSSFSDTSCHVCVDATMFQLHNNELLPHRELTACQCH